MLQGGEGDGNGVSFGDCPHKSSAEKLHVVSWDAIAEFGCAEDVFAGEVVQG